MKANVVIDKIRAACRGDSEALTLSRSECDLLNVELSVLLAQERSWARECSDLRELNDGLREIANELRGDLSRLRVRYRIVESTGPYGYDGE